MSINIRAKGIELTESTRDYVTVRLASLDKFCDLTIEGNNADIELEQTTQHHAKGDIFRAEVNLFVSGKQYFADARGQSIESAIDEVKDEIICQLKREKEKTRTFFDRGSNALKKMLKRI